MNSKNALLALIDAALTDNIIIPGDITSLADRFAGSGGGYPVNNNVELPEGYYRGTFKSFSMNSGFGFIENEELKNQYNADVFLHKNQHREYVQKYGQLYP